MEQKYGEFVGVDKLMIAEVTEDSAANYTVGSPEALAPVAEIAGEPEISNKTTYYDNKAANNYVTEGKTELKIVVSNVPAELMAKLLGKNYNTSDGIVYDGGQADPPDFALGYRFAMGNGYRYYWFHKGNFSGGSEEATTKTNDVDEKTYTLTFTAVTTAHEWTVNSKTHSLKRVYGDTHDTNFDPTDWFTAVKVPPVV